MLSARTPRLTLSILELVPLPSGGSGYDAQKDKQFGNAATIIGVNKSESEKKFRAGALKLTAGRHITENDSRRFWCTKISPRLTT